MPVFTGTPVDVAPSPPAPPFIWFNFENNFNGPHRYNGNLYLPGLVPSGSSPLYQVAKSTDEGATWDLFPTGVLDIGDYIGAVLDAGNNEIVMFGVSAAAVNIIYFDLIAETFSSVFTLPTGTLNTLQLSLCQRPDGDIICAYSKQNDGLYAVHVSSGGSFGSPVLIEARPGTKNFRARNAVSDSTNTTHILYWQGALPTTLRYNTLSDVYAPGTPSEAVAAGDPFSFFVLTGFQVFDGKLVTVDQTSDPCRILVGDPYTGPSWAFQDVHTITPDITDVFATAVNFGAFLRVFYMHQETTPDPVLEVMYADWDGSVFTAPAVWWDIIADPPVGTTGIDPADFGIIGITAALDAVTGATEVAIVITIDPTNDNQSIVFASTGGTRSGYRNRVIY
jgi:hypothetical protein